MKGGKSRAVKMTKEERSESARKAARIAVGRLIIAEGGTIADFARSFGISHQLASRLICEGEHLDRRAR